MFRNMVARVKGLLFPQIVILNQRNKSTLHMCYDLFIPKELLTNYEGFIVNYKKKTIKLIEQLCMLLESWFPWRFQNFRPVH